MMHYNSGKVIMN